MTLRERMEQVRRLIPKDVLVCCSAEAERRLAEGTPKSRLAAAGIALLWAAVLGLVIWRVVSALRGQGSSSPMRHLARRRPPCPREGFWYHVLPGRARRAGMVGEGRG
jgi:hypothetical protein